MNTPRPRSFPTRSLFLGVAAAWLSACSQSVDPTPASSAAGVYQLQRIGTRSLPTPIVVNGYRTIGDRLAVDSLVVLSGSLELGVRAFSGTNRTQWTRDGVPGSVNVSTANGVVRVLDGSQIELVNPGGCSVVYAVLDGGRELRSRPGGVLCGIAVYVEEVWRRVE